MQLISGALVLASAGAKAERLDVIVDGGTIADLVPPGSVQGEGMERVDAAGRALIPGLVNGHNHAQTHLAKGLFDRYTLETYLNQMPWATARRTQEDKHLSSLIGAAEMALKGCTAGYDMFAEFPLPGAEGVEAVARGYADVGLRAAIAPMMADRTFYEAIPGLADAFPEPLRTQALQARAAPHEASIAACREILRGWKFDRDVIRPALGPTIPHHCSDAFLVACRDLAREHGLGVQMHVAESKMQAVVARKLYGKSLVAHLGEVGAEVADVMATGRWIVRDRKLLTVDVAKLRCDAQAAVVRLMEVNTESRGLSQALHPHVGHFCAGLAHG